MQASVRDFKAHLSSYLHQVEAGEEVVITSHERPVAKLVPMKLESSVSFERERDQYIAELEALAAEIPQCGEPLSKLLIKERRAARY